MVVADLENDFFLEAAVFVGEEVSELGGIAVQARIHAGRKHDRRSKRAVGVAAQGAPRRR